MKFCLKRENPQIEFDVKIDNTGDLMVKANGTSLFYIDSTSGILELFIITKAEQENLPGLSFDQGGFLFVSK